MLSIKDVKKAKIRNRYNQAPHGKVTQHKSVITSNTSKPLVSPFPAGDHKAEDLIVIESYNGLGICHKLFVE